MSVQALTQVDPTQFFNLPSANGAAPQRLDTKVSGVAISNDFSGRLSVTTAEAALNTILYTDLAELWSAQQAIDDWYIKWGDALSEADADKTVRFSLIGGKQGEMRRSEIVLHVVNHTSYHRGFVADMFFQIPARPPLTDLPVFLMSR